MKSKKENRIGRNDPCWCDSGKKYKHCHLDREYQAEVTKGEIISNASKARVKASCFHSPVDSAHCNGKIIQSHTVSKSGSLRRIAKDGHVLNFKPNINTLYKTGGVFEIVEVGISQASTFPGFCAHHDKSLFAPIEDQVFQVNSYHATLLGYRALSREYYAKFHQAAGNPFLATMDKGKSIGQQLFLQKFVRLLGVGIDFAQRDLGDLREKYNEAFSKNDFSNSKYLVIETNEDPHILFSGLIFPECDFEGNVLQELGSPNPLDLISINAVATPGGGFVIFQWFGESAACQKLMQSLRKRPTNDLANAITILAFEFIENLFISPDWWGSLNASAKKALELRVMNMAHKPDCLTPDNIKLHEWRTPKFHANWVQ